MIPLNPYSEFVQHLCVCLNIDISNTRNIRNKQMEHAWVIYPILLFVAQFYASYDQLGVANYIIYILYIVYIVTKELQLNEKRRMYQK